MNVGKVKKEILKLADAIDDYLGELEEQGKDNSRKYQELLYIAGGLRELLEVEFDA